MALRKWLAGRLRNFYCLRTKAEFKNFQPGKPFLVIFLQALIFGFFCIKAKERENNQESQICDIVSKRR